MQALGFQPLDDVGDDARVRYGFMRKRAVRRLGWIDARFAVHVIHPLRTVVIRRQRVVVDRPRRRHAVDVLDLAKVVAPEPVEYAAPELGVAADAVVRVGAKRSAGLVEPGLGRAVTQLLPDG